MIAHEIIDAHAHIYPEGCLNEVVRDRDDFKLVAGPRGQALIYRGSHVMSVPTEQDNLPKRLASMDEAGIGMAILSVGALNVGWAGAGDAAAQIAEAIAGKEIRKVIIVPNKLVNIVIN